MTDLPDSVGADVDAILDGIDVPLIVVSREGTLSRFNRAAREAFSLVPADAGVSRGDTQHLSLRAIGNGDWNTPDLWRSLGEAASGATEFEPREIEVVVPSLGR